MFLWNGHFEFSASSVLFCNVLRNGDRDVTFTSVTAAENVLEKQQSFSWTWLVLWHTILFTGALRLGFEQHAVQSCNPPSVCIGPCLVTESQGSSLQSQMQLPQLS